MDFKGTLRAVKAVIRIDQCAIGSIGTPVRSGYGDSYRPGHRARISALALQSNCGHGRKKLARFLHNLALTSTNSVLHPQRKTPVLIGDEGNRFPVGRPARVEVIVSLR